MLFIVRMMQKSVMLKIKSYVCFVDLEKAFDRLPRKVL